MGARLMTVANVQGADCPLFRRLHQALSAERGGEGGAEFQNSRAPSATPGPLSKCTEFLIEKQKFENLKPEPPPPEGHTEDGSSGTGQGHAGGWGGGEGELQCAGEQGSFRGQRWEAQGTGRPVEGSGGALLFHILQATDNCPSRSTGTLVFLDKMAQREGPPWQQPRAALLGRSWQHCHRPPREPATEHRQDAERGWDDWARRGGGGFGLGGQNPEPARRVSQGHWGRGEDRHPQGPAQGGSGGSPVGGPPLGWVPDGPVLGSTEGSCLLDPHEAELQMSGEPHSSRDERRCAGGQACLRPREDPGTGRG